jgi:hypothetical protein
MFDVNPGGSAIILAGTVDCLRRKAPDIFGYCLVVKEGRLPGSAQVAQHKLTSWNRGDHSLKHLIRLCHKHPMPRVQSPVARSIVPHEPGWKDV